MAAYMAPAVCGRLLKVLSTNTRCLHSRSKPGNRHRWKSLHCTNSSAVLGVTVKDQYDRLVQSGFLRNDVQQRRVLLQLAQLQEALEDYSCSMYHKPPLALKSQHLSKDHTIEEALPPDKEEPTLLPPPPKASISMVMWVLEKLC
ncbi:hypothetical protein WMY93_016364 [Mugilogobius chulae]|uniref:Uncharacterized protein n=1 Tax=Mugilogobius chulae TaxID=88201 RepID=A0AAW0NTP1_9GOBI